MQRIPGKQLTITTPDELLHLIERIAKKNSIKEVQAARFLMMLGAEVYTDLEKAFIPQLIGLLLNMKWQLNQKRFFYEEKAINNIIPQ